MHPIETLRNQTRLVALNRPDEVPLQRAEQGPLWGCDPGGVAARIASANREYDAAASDARLQRAEQGPLWGCDPGERGDFFDRFLHVVFAERVLSMGMRSGYGIGTERLGYGNQTDIRGVAAA